MERRRKRFQGVSNIIRFNWHFYAAACGAILLLLLAANLFFPAYVFYVNLLCSLALFSVAASLVVSYYVYDLSNLYELAWLDETTPTAESNIVNINAGFDETSILLQRKFPNAQLTALDFYDPARHTEVSIKRARKAYPPYPNTRQTVTAKLPLNDDSADRIFVILSAHEIRNGEERTAFFTELRRVLKPGGRIFLTEHLRDAPNFLAYNVGAFHFHSRRAWLENIRGANLEVNREFKITPFITTFVLEKNGIAS